MLNFTPLDEDELYEAVNLYIDNPRDTIKKLGIINSWNVINIKNMKNLFGNQEFNYDISN